MMVLVEMMGLAVVVLVLAALSRSVPLRFAARVPLLPSFHSFAKPVALD